MESFQEIVSRIDMSDVTVEQEPEFLGYVYLRGVTKPVKFTTQAYHSVECLADYMTVIIATTPFLHIRDIEGITHVLRCVRVDHFTVEPDQE